MVLRCFLPLRAALLCLTVCVFAAGCAGKNDAAPSEGAAKVAYSGQVGPEARQAYGEALALWPQGMSSLAGVERCLNPAQAVELLDRALQLEPDYAEAFVRRGLAKSELGAREEAFDDLTAAIRLHPTAEAYAYRGLVSIRAKDWRAAGRDLDYSLELDRSQSKAHNLKGVLALGQDDRSRACEFFQKGCANGDCFFMETAVKEKICRTGQ